MILTDLPLSPFDALLVLIVFALFSATCGKGLDSTTCTSHEDKLYCKACYGKAFGPKGYGFAGGAAGLSANVPSGLFSSNDLVYYYITERQR